MIEPAVEAILVDLFVAELKQIAQRRAARSVLGDMQLARGLAEPRRNQNCRQLRPRDVFPLARGQLLAQILKAYPAP
jgi:hypothetical protein